MKDGALGGNKREELWLLCVDRIFHEGRNLYMEKESIQSGQNQVSYGWFNNKMKYILFNNS